MNTAIWQVPFLALTSAVVLWSGIDMVGRPSQAETNYTPYTFAARVPLTGWQDVASEPLRSIPPLLAYDELMVAHRYRYQNEDHPLSVEVRYLVDTEGDVDTYARAFTPERASTAAERRNTAGSYRLYTVGNQAVLSACVNPRGGSTVSAEQFRTNRKAHDLQPTRLVPWLLNREYLFDNRCLWTQMTVPLTNTTVETAFRSLENSWIAWYPQANRNFPPH